MHYTVIALKNIADKFSSILSKNFNIQTSKNLGEEKIFTQVWLIVVQVSERLLIVLDLLDQQIFHKQVLLP